MYSINFFTILADILILGLIALSIWLGYKRGAVRILFLPRHIYALIAAYKGFPGLSETLSGRYLKPYLTEKLLNVVNTTLEGKTITTESIKAAIPDFFYRVAKLNDFNIDSTVDNIFQASGDVSETIRSVAENAAMLIGSFIAFASCYIIFSLITWGLKKLAEYLTSPDRKRFTKTVDKILGTVFGVVAAFFFALVFSYVLGYSLEVATTYDKFAFLGFRYENTFLIKFFINWNPFAFFA